jgi:hypothetical protein
MGWDSLDVNTSNSESKGKVEYAKLGVGSHIIRFLDNDIFSRWTHWIPAANGGKGFGVNCIGKDCPICEIRKSDPQGEGKKYSNRQKHAVNILERELDSKGQPTGVTTLSLLDKGNMLFNSIRDIKNMSESTHGDITNYDIRLQASPTNKPNQLSYTGLPMNPTPLSDADKELALDKVKLEEFFVPFTRDEIIRFMAGATVSEVIESREDKNEVVDFKQD